MLSQTPSIEETVSVYARQLQDAQPSRVHKTLIEMQRLAEEEVIKMQTLMHESNLSFDVLIHVVFVYLICFVQPDSYVNVESNIIVIFDIYVSVEWQISL